MEFLGRGGVQKKRRGIVTEAVCSWGTKGWSRKLEVPEVVKRTRNRHRKRLKYSSGLSALLARCTTRPIPMASAVMMPM